MPGSRSPGQKQVLVLMQEPFVEAIDGKLAELGYSDRAAFIRDAVYKEMMRCGVDLPAAIKTAPQRKGKGGRPKKQPAAEPAGPTGPEAPVTHSEQDHNPPKKRARRKHPPT